MHRRSKFILLALCAFSCTSSEKATYGDVCQTVRQVCTVADALCFFAPRMNTTKLDSTAREKQVRRTLHELDSLTTVLHNQLGD